MLIQNLGVFSAYAEVFLSSEFKRIPCFSFLRVRGGVSNLKASAHDMGAFSPRTRRCFHLYFFCSHLRTVFSAYAEVFPKTTNTRSSNLSFLRVRGGVSLVTKDVDTAAKFSPRTRRCFSCYASLILKF